MINHIKITLLFSFAAILLFSSCTDEKKQLEKANAHDIKVYHQAAEYGDVGTAIYAIHSLLARDTSNIAYYDTLSMLYFESRNYPQAVQSAQRALAKDPDNEKLLQVVANSYKYMGRGDVALPYFLKLSEITNNPQFAYEAAVIEFYGKQYTEAEAAINKLLNSPASENYSVGVPSGQGKEQPVPLRAALYNLLGYIKQNQEKPEEAKTAYQKALDLYPEFILAENNLKELQKNKK